MSGQSEIGEDRRRWWITAPLGHRQYAYDHRPTSMMFLGQEVPVISGPQPELDDWICDWCNATIPLEFTANDGVVRPRLIAMFMSSALCDNCMAESLQEDGLPLNTASWGLWLCSCPPCRVTAKSMVEIATAGVKWL